MIAQFEADPTCAEVVFFLATTANPLVGLTLHSFASNSSTNEVQVRLPVGSWFSPPGSQIVEKGDGWYAVQLTSSQTVFAGTVLVRAVVSGAQPVLDDDMIGTTGGELALYVDGYIPFFLPNASNPIYGTPITGHTFASGEVTAFLPGATVFVNATLANIVELGFGSYALKLLASAGQTNRRGKAFIHVDIGASSQPYNASVTILGVTSGVAPVAAVVDQTAVASPFVSTSPLYVDHVAAALGRLPQQFREKSA